LEKTLSAEDAKHDAAGSSAAASAGAPAQGFGAFILHPAARLLEKDGDPVPLGSRAFDILCRLVDSSGEVVSKDDLMAAAWPDLTVEEGSLRFHIARLRRALGDGVGGKRYIENLPGRGYCFVTPVRPIAPQGQPAPCGASPLRPPRGLPYRLNRIVGRDETLERIATELTSRRLVTIHGPGGIGKTTLAIAAAHGLLDAFAGDIRFLDLAPIGDAPLVAGALASVLGIAAQSNDPTGEVIDVLRNRRMLILFDSCEHVIDTLAPLAERIHHEAPQVSILATSREPLRVAGEHVVALPPLDQPPEGLKPSASQILGYAATRLFVERAASMGYEAGLGDAEAAIVTKLCRKLDGIPLAIELVASRVAVHGLHETAGLVDGRLKLLWRGRRTARPRHQTLKATIDWSYALIGEEERCALRRLAVFVGPFDLAAAKAVVPDGSGAGQEATEWVVQALEELTAKCLVSIQRGNGTTRYRLLDTTRDYARQKLAEAGELEAVSRRHAACILHVLHESKSSPPAGDPARRRQAVRDTLGDVNAALRWCFSEGGDPLLAVRLAAAATRLFIELSLLSECRRWCERALAMMSQGLNEPALELALNSALGHAQMFTDGNGEDALKALERARALASRLEDRESEFRLLSRLHMYYRRTGRISLLAPIARQAEAMAIRIGDPAGIAAAHDLLGVSFHLAGDQALARTHLETALHMDEFRRIGSDHFAFHRNPFIALSRSLWLLGYPDQAVAAAKPLVTEHVAPDAVTYSIGLIWGAAVFQWVGDWASFDALAERLRGHAADHALRPYEAVSLGMQGESLVRAGQVHGGLTYLRSAITVLRKDSYSLYLPHFCATMAHGLAEIGELSEAQSLIDHTLSSVIADGGSFELPEMLRIRGQIRARRGDAEGALASLGEAIALAERQGALSWRLRAEISRAQLAPTENRKKSYASLEQAYAAFAEGFDTSDLAAARQEIG
jgi:predicted ATPase/DNA-binding winged helix-turn-helix (wHTH) protein